MADGRNAIEVEVWAIRSELRRARFEVSVAVHHLLLLAGTFYVAVAGVSLWYSYAELAEHGRSWAWWEWPVWGALTAAFWLVVFGLAFGGTQLLAIAIVGRLELRRMWRQAPPA